MDAITSLKSKLLAGAISLIGWLGLAIQFYLTIVNRTVPIPETIIRYFSFFTIWINLLIAVCSTILALERVSGRALFFGSSKTLTAITAYITLGGLVYNIVLRQLWAPEGLQRVADEILHLVIPVLFLLYWLYAVPKINFRDLNVAKWLLFPGAYVLFALSRGAVSGFYPYPFLDVTALGFKTVLLNSLGLGLAIIVFSFLLVLIGKLVRKSIR